MNTLKNKELQEYNSFRTKSNAKFFSSPDSTAAIISLLKNYPDEKKLILGSGYNLFFTKDFDGLVIKPNISGIQVVGEGDDFVEIEAGAAEDWDHFVEHCVSLNLAGVENLSHIPGSVGAAPIQNIGAYGSEVKDVITTVKCIDTETNEVVLFDNESCKFEYRDSVFKKTRRYIITSVVFRLSKSYTYREKYSDLNKELHNTPHPSLSQVRNAVIRVRERKLPDPALLPNAGSFFKNPILTAKQKESLQNLLPDAPVYDIGDDLFKTSAAFLIDKAGYKGKRKGLVGTYEKHALIIVNYGTSDGNEIADFKSEIQAVVQEKYGISLEPEVWIF